MLFVRRYDHGRIVQEVRAGADDRAAAAVVGCDPNYAGQIRRRAGLPSNGRRLWTPEDDRTLVSMLAAGRPHAAIARELRRDGKSVSARVTRLRLGREFDPRTDRIVDRKSRSWTLFVAGRSAREVAHLIGIPARTARRYRQMMPRWWATESAIVGRKGAS